MAMDLTTSEAEEVLSLNRSDANIHEHARSAQSSEEFISSGQGSIHLVRVQPPMARTNTHPAGVTILPTLHPPPIEGVTPPVANVNWQCSSHNNQTFLNSKSSKISADEAVSLEGLIRSCLAFQPDDRILILEIRGFNIKDETICH
ncbi:uncharacterized protein Bfra_000189 [Botrytis fragariae]|uniref:Uncharacterized protein n=1 Tax=Botrytis fragariae TaxID=1964551 RepID=A0A8H6B2U9_9HELO|nr:uncharacterized protein Bfra_000189 [Botrytis fragariae]KAF5878022.1 hypothetical protein Bfra_000189 [Botrytis fragariae]